jgi:hypothetical protein
VNGNVEEIQNSVNAHGLLRLPVIAHIKNENENYIIDGNHLRKALILQFKEEKSTKSFPCILVEYSDSKEAGDAFTALSTKGKKLDYVDYTKLYRDLNLAGAPYSDVWAMIGKPSNRGTLLDNMKGRKLSLPTLIECLVGDKNAYKSGDSKTDKITDYCLKENLLTFWIQNEDRYMDEYKSILFKPNGGAIISMFKVWFSKRYYEKFTKEQFMTFVFEIFKNKQVVDPKNEVPYNKDAGAGLIERYIKNLQ